MKTKSLFKYSIITILFNAGLLLLGHLYVNSKIELSETIKEAWWTIHVFLFLASFIGIFAISRNFERTGEVTSFGKTYLFYTTLKILAAIGFLVPWLLGDKNIAKNFAGHFFAIFFPYLFVETILLIRYLNGPLDEKSKSDENQASK
jgi:hypothetical protein